MKWLALIVLVHWLYDSKCCADKDCHPVPCEEIQDIATGWIWRPLGHAAVLFKKNALKVSPDGNCHVCHLGYGPGENGLCTYLPSRV
jgi:hypothetical protein